MDAGELDPSLPLPEATTPADLDHRLADAVGSIYATAMAPELWPDALEKVAGVFGSRNANLFYTRDDGSFGIFVTPSMRVVQDEYDRQWWKEDIRSVRAIEYGYAAGVEAITDRHVVSEAEMAEHPFYKSFLRPHGLGWFAGVAINPDPGIVLALTVHRAMDEPPFSDDELRIMTRLGRFAENALRLSSRLLTAEMTNLAFGDVLARLKVGVYIIGDSGKLLLANPLALSMMQKALTITDGRLAARFEAEKGELQKTIDAVIKSDPKAPGPIAPPVVIHGVEKEDDYAVAYVLPVHAGQDHPLARALVDARAIVVVRESKAHDPIDAALVRDLLDVTLGEARVASLVGAGFQPKEAAAQLGIAEETARSVLKRVFAKTGVSRQSDLAALLSRLVLR